jgi:AcrR family transcriptional regulator
MQRTNARTRRLRPPLSRERILDVAIGLADTGGLPALTMRGLGHALGVEAMSLYNHVDDKDDVLDGIVDQVLFGIDLTPAADDWRASIRETAISAHGVLVRHPWSCELVLLPNRPSISIARIRYIESILARLRSAGFSSAGASRGYHAVDSHVLGFTLWELGHAMPDDAPPDFLETLLSSFDFSDYPYLAEHAREHLKKSEVPDVGEFEFGLDLILDGLERIRDTV